jgi:hypothetical protein
VVVGLTAFGFVEIRLAGPLAAVALVGLARFVSSFFADAFCRLAIAIPVPLLG